MQMAIRILDFVLVTIVFLSVKKGFDTMLDLYIALVIAGRRTCNPATNGVTLVPERYRAQVIDNLNAIGLDADGNPIVG
jgi:hypothetical protein